MKICVIGNSHIAALKVGWDRISSEYPGASIDFYGSDGQTLKNLRVDSRSLVPTTNEVELNIQGTSGGKRRINVDEYDELVVAGLGLALHWVVDVYAEVRADHHSRNSEYLVSASVFNAAVEHSLSEKAALHLHRAFIELEVADKLTLMPNPLPGAGLEGHPRSSTWRELDRNQDGDELVQFFNDYLNAQTRTGARVLRQQSCTIEGNLFTKREFATELADGTTDSVHMNEDYGALVMSDLLLHLGHVAK